MSVDLTCKTCEGKGVHDHLGYQRDCGVCDSAGRRRPTLREWDTLIAERDWLRERIVTIDVDGRPLRYDKLAEAEAALGAIEQSYAILDRERDRYREALERITRDEGKVCSAYEICEHGSCGSSYSSWAIARAALDGDSGLSS